MALHNFFTHCVEHQEYKVFLDTYELYNKGKVSFSLLWLQSTNDFAENKIRMLTTALALKEPCLTSLEAKRMLCEIEKGSEAAKRLQLYIIKNPTKKQPKEFSTSTPLLNLREIASVGRWYSMPEIAVVSSKKSANDKAKILCAKERDLFLRIVARNLLHSPVEKERILTWFNKLSHYITHYVLCKDTLESRKHAIKHWIKVAQYSNKYNNFSTLMAILAAINNIAVQRLDCWKTLHPNAVAEFIKLEIIMEHKSNYKNYRFELENRENGIVPYLGVIFRDITLTWE
uniref:RasGEF domain protein n=1 Tax=Pithovirus LCPAC304 TaxID=2506594 RepID=A0A481Z9C7_9VIRU|nr:MAG: RasGEF domain protein [Pithovirus LCPAC304]